MLLGGTRLFSLFLSFLKAGSNPAIHTLMNILNKKTDDFRRTTDGKIIQGSSHTCRVLNHKERNKIIIKAVCDLRKIKDQFDTIACCGVSGLMVVPQIAELLDKHILIIRKDERCYSEFRTEGVAPFQYVVVDDLVCSGDTIKRIQNTIKDEYSRAICKGIYFYIPDQCVYRPDEDGSKLCLRDLKAPLLNLSR
jgi:adenine/guanine phosphoribosyltransferase-like PRPP-binding protein